jgi:hemolysin activation/secretion protein
LSFGARLHAQSGPQDLQSNREEIRRRQQQEQAEQQERMNQPRVDMETPLAQIPAGKTDADGIFVDDKTGFLIRHIVIETGGFEYPWLRPIAEKFEGKKLGMAGIQQAIKLLGNSFIKRGYVTTRVLLPEQDIAGTHTIIFIVARGTVGKVAFSDKSSAHGSTWWNAFPTRKGKQLNIRDLEQGLEQMKRVPTQDVTMDLKPGANTNQTDVIVTQKASFPIRGSLGIDNSGDKNTGRWATNATISWDGPFFLNDLFSYTYNGVVATSSGQGTRGDNASYSIPFGYLTAYASYNTYSYHQTVRGFYNPYESSGTSRNMEARLVWLARRTQRQKTSLQMRLTRRSNRNYIDGTELEVQRRDTTAIEFALLHQASFRSTMIDGSLAYRFGSPWFNSETDAPDHMANTPTFNYRIFTANATVRAYFTVFSLNCSFQASLNAQMTGDTLYGSEYFSIGSRYTVRGFDGRQTLGAEKGVTLRNEFGVTIPKSTGQTIYIAVDGGIVKGPGDYYNSGSTLAGGALGLRGGWRWFYYDATVGCPLYKPAGLHTGRVTWTAQAGMQF